MGNGMQLVWLARWRATMWQRRDDCHVVSDNGCHDGEQRCNGCCVASGDGYCDDEGRCVWRWLDRSPYAGWWSYHRVREVRCACGGVVRESLANVEGEMGERISKYLKFDLFSECCDDFFLKHHFGVHDMWVENLTKQAYWKFTNPGMNRFLIRIVIIDNQQNKIWEDQGREGRDDADNITSIHYYK